MYWYNPTEYYENIAKKMYPSRYHRLKPYIKMVCSREDHPHNPGMYPFPNEEKLNKMTEEIIQYYLKDYEDDLTEEELQRGRHHHHHHHNNLFEDIIRILIIKELIERRCKKRPHCW